MRFDGPLIVSPLVQYFSSEWVRYEYPNSGFQLIDFFGEPVLAPIDIDLYLRTAYGPNYMEPSLAKSCSNCFPSREVIRAREYMDHLAFAGMTLNYKAMCDSLTPHCASPFAITHLLTRMYEYVNDVSKSIGRKYTLACDAFSEQVGNAIVPASYAAVAIQLRDADKWLEALRNVSKTTTFVFSEGHDDGSIARLQYSRINEAILVVYTLSEHVLIKPSTVWLSKQVSSRIHTSKKDSKLISNLCRRCKNCQPTPTSKIRYSGSIVSQYNHKCLTGTADGNVGLGSCQGPVCA